MCVWVDVISKIWHKNNPEPRKNTFSHTKNSLKSGQKQISEKIEKMSNFTKTIFKQTFNISYKVLTFEKCRPPSPVEKIIIDHFLYKLLTSGLDPPPSPLKC